MYLFSEELFFYFFKIEGITSFKNDDVYVVHITVSRLCKITSLINDFTDK